MPNLQRTAGRNRRRVIKPGCLPDRGHPAATIQSKHFPNSRAPDTLQTNPCPQGAIAVKSSKLAVRQTTLSGNAAAAAGGGLSLRTSGAALGSCTIVDNSAPAGAALAVAEGAHLDADNCIIYSGGGLTDFSRKTDATWKFRASLMTDPKLGPLADNGGPTPSHAPLPGSPALGGGAKAYLDPLLDSTDQRGLPRTSGDGGVGGAGSVDMGAVEVHRPAPPAGGDSGAPRAAAAAGVLSSMARTGGAGGGDTGAVAISRPASAANHSGPSAAAALP